MAPAETVGGQRVGTRPILVVVHGGTVDSPSQLVNDGRREGVRQLHNIIGGADERPIDAAQGVERCERVGVVDVQPGEDGGLIREGVIQTEHPAVFADVVTLRLNPFVGDAVTDGGSTFPCSATGRGRV